MHMFMCVCYSELVSSCQDISDKLLAVLNAVKKKDISEAVPTIICVCACMQLYLESNAIVSLSVTQIFNCMLYVRTCTYYL